MINTIVNNRKQIVLFVIAGAVCALLQVFFTLVFVEIFNTKKEIVVYGSIKINIDYFVSVILATTIGIVVNYFLSIRYIFEGGKHSKAKEFYLFLCISSSTAILTYLVSSFLLKYFSVEYIEVFIKSAKQQYYFKFRKDIAITQIITIIIVSVFNYIIKKKIVFSK